MTAIAVQDATLLSTENLKTLRQHLLDDFALSHRCLPNHTHRVIVSITAQGTDDGVHQPVLRDEFFSYVALEDNDREEVARVIEDYVDDCLPELYEETTALVECVPLIKKTSKKRVFRDGDTDDSGFKIRRAVTTSAVCIDLTGEDKPEDKGVYFSCPCGVTVTLPSWRSCQ